MASTLQTNNNKIDCQPTSIYRTTTRIEFWQLSVKKISKITDEMKVYSVLFSMFLWLLIVFLVDGEPQVEVESISKRDGDPVPVTAEHVYSSDVTLYMENSDGERIPSGWSTRVVHGAKKEEPFEFQPGVNLIKGWSMGVLQMDEGERAFLHVPSLLGYGGRPMGSKGGAFYIPANSNLLFDIKIRGKAGDQELEL